MGIIQFIDAKLKENEDEESWRPRLKRDYIRLWTKDSSYGSVNKGVVFSKLELELDKNLTLQQVVKAVSKCALL